MWRLLALCACLMAGPVAAQDATIAPPILTLDQERLYTASLFAERVRDTLAARSRVLAAENRRIEATLREEERQLTEDRATMEPAEFRVLAEDFDERVTAIRAAQANKRDALQGEADGERTRFFQLAYPVLFEMVQEAGALAILNQNAVILSLRSIDVTELAIERVNAAIGEAPPPPVTPDPPPRRPEQPARLPAPAAPATTDEN
jgi:Skp family chaperone for outer membrane proteins